MAPAPAAKVPDLALAVELISVKRDMVRYLVVSLDRAQPFEKLGRARQVARAFMELIEAQAELERALLAEIRALRGAADGA